MDQTTIGPDQWRTLLYAYILPDSAQSGLRYVQEYGGSFEEVRPCDSDPSGYCGFAIDSDLSADTAAGAFVQEVYDAYIRAYNSANGQNQAAAQDGLYTHTTLELREYLDRPSMISRALCQPQVTSLKVIGASRDIDGGHIVQLQPTVPGGGASIPISVKVDMSKKLLTAIECQE